MFVYQDGLRKNPKSEKRRDGRAGNESDEKKHSKRGFRKTGELMRICHGSTMFMALNSIQHIHRTIVMSTKPFSEGWIVARKGEYSA